MWWVIPPLHILLPVLFPSPGSLPLPLPKSCLPTWGDVPEPIPFSLPRLCTSIWGDVPEPIPFSLPRLCTSIWGDVPGADRGQGTEGRGRGKGVRAGQLRPGTTPLPITSSDLQQWLEFIPVHESFPQCPGEVRHHHPACARADCLPGHAAQRRLRRRDALHPRLGDGAPLLRSQ